MTHSIDFNKITYFDLAKDLSKTVLNDIDFLENDLAVVESITNILVTEPRSKVYNNRGFGAKLDQFIFEPIDIITANNMLEVLEFAIGENESRARDLEIEITPDEDANTFIIDIKFFIDQSDRQIELLTTLEKVR